MNRLQTIDSSVYGDIFVTMNPLVEPLAECVQAEYYYTHPLYNQQVCNLYLFLIILLHSSLFTSLIVDQRTTASS